MDTTIPSPNPQADQAPLTSQVFTPTSVPNKKRRKTLLATGGVFLLLVGLVSSVLLIRQSQFFGSSAWDCGNYTFTVSLTGQVKAINNSTRNEPLQKADVFINSSKVATLNVPALASGQNQVIGQVTPPASGGFLWEVRGTADCSAAGNYANLAAKCVQIDAYDQNWNKLTASQLASLSPNDVVRFAVAGSATSGQFTKARFTINGTLQAETTSKRPTSNDYYEEYLIPDGTTSFTINAELYHDTLAKWL